MRKGLYLLKEIGILVAAVAAMVILALGITWFMKYRPTDRAGEVRPAVLSIESALRSLISESIKTTQNTVETPELDEALHTITSRLLEEIEPLPYEVEILVLNSPLVNAVNFPGGLIVVYSGLIGELGSTEEMAAVIAHELGHVVNRDSVKSLMRQMGIATFFSLNTLSANSLELISKLCFTSAITPNFGFTQVNMSLCESIHLSKTLKLSPTSLLPLSISFFLISSSKAWVAKYSDNIDPPKVVYSLKAEPLLIISSLPIIQPTLNPAKPQTLDKLLVITALS